MRSFQDASEAAPDRYIRYEYPEHLDMARQAAADYLKVARDDLVLVPNVTTAINAVLRNLVFQPGDVIVYVDTAYGSVEKTIDYVVETTPAESVKVEFALPCPDEEIVRRFADALDAHRGKARIAVFDTIASLPSVRLPFERLTQLAREQGIFSLVDGAHGIGHLPLDLNALDADFFTSNCHKYVLDGHEDYLPHDTYLSRWLYTPRGCAILHVPQRNQHLLRSSLPTSHFFEPRPRPGHKGIRPPNPLPPSSKSNFVQQFEFVGSVDNASLLCIPAALDFRRTACGGEQDIMQYCWDLAARGGKLVADVLGTEVMDNQEGSLTRECAMVMVRLPLHVQQVGMSGHPAEGIPPGQAPRVQAWLCETLVRNHSTFIAIIFYRNQWWARFSAQIYLELQDFEWGAQVLEELCQELASGLPGE